MTKFSTLFLSNLLLFLCMGMIFNSCQSQENNNEDALELVEVIQFEDLEKYLHASDDRLYVINFWATWCKPCIEELPYFEKIAQTPAYQQWDAEN